ILLPFLSIPRPPPSPTLFPYTTLFRSRYVSIDRVGCRCDAGTQERFPEATIAIKHAKRKAARQRTSPPGLHLAKMLCATGKMEPDRKSTRLNSSHLGISYAVFCLKKKI